MIPVAQTVVDGRTRLDLMEELVRQVVNDKGEWIGALMGKVEHKPGKTHEEVTLEVISYNGHRRHALSKQQLAESIVATLKAAREMAGATDLRKVQRSAERGTGGRLLGSTKDEFKAIATKQVVAAGSSKHAVQRALAKAKPEPPRPRKPKPPVDKLKPEYVNRRFGMFLKHWPSHTDQRKVREILRGSSDFAQANGSQCHCALRIARR